MRHSVIVLSASAISAVLLGLALVPKVVTAQEKKAAPEYIFPSPGPFSPETVPIPNAAAIAAWARSGHSDASAEAFAHWNAEGSIPPICSTCHSGAGFRSLHGLDGTAVGPPEKPVPTGGVVDCDTCHNPGLAQVTEVRLPSGLLHPVAPGEAACLTCHQGRGGGGAVERATAVIGADIPDPGLSFINPHYKVAAAMWLGGYGGGGFHYPGKSYSGRFFHARPVATCVSCHDPHALTVAEETCLTCHQSGDPAAIRISRQSHDGSGNLKQGIRADIDTNAALLMDLIGTYAEQVAGLALVYDAHRHPYFFADANGDGVIDQSDGRPIAYGAWTPRMLKAAYNWKFVTADPGVQAHNPHYALELLYDSIEDIAIGQDRAVSEFGIQR